MAAADAAVVSRAETALETFNRAQMAVSLRETVEELKQTVARTRTKNGTLRSAKFLAEVLALRFSGRSPTDTAQILGCPVSRVTEALARGREDATFAHLIDRVDKIILPLAVDNLALGVMQGDKDYTRDVVKGRGILVQHKSIEQHSTKTVMTLQVTLTMPPHLAGGPLPVARPGSIVGSPTDPTLLHTLPPAGLLEGEIVR